MGLSCGEISPRLSRYYFQVCYRLQSSFNTPGWIQILGLLGYLHSQSIIQALTSFPPPTILKQCQGIKDERSREIEIRASPKLKPKKEKPNRRESHYVFHISTSVSSYLCQLEYVGTKIKNRDPVYILKQKGKVCIGQFFGEAYHVTTVKCHISPL